MQFQSLQTATNEDVKNVVSSWGILLSFVVSYSFQARHSLQNTEILMSHMGKSVALCRSDKTLLSVSLAVGGGAGCLLIFFIWDFSSIADYLVHMKNWLVIVGSSV